MALKGELSAQFRSAEPAQQQPSQPAARIHVNKQALNAEKNDQLSKTEALSQEASAPVGKKGMRWWYVGNKGKDRKAGIAAQQKALEDARRVTEDAMKAAQTGDLATLTRLADQGWPIDSRDKFGGTALHWAAGKGRCRRVCCVCVCVSLSHFSLSLYISLSLTAKPI